MKPQTIMPTIKIAASNTNTTILEQIPYDAFQISRKINVRG